MKLLVVIFYFFSVTGNKFDIVSLLIGNKMSLFYFGKNEYFFAGYVHIRIRRYLILEFFFIQNIHFLNVKNTIVKRALHERHVPGTLGNVCHRGIFLS